MSPIAMATGAATQGSEPAGRALRPLYLAAFVAYADRFAIAPVLVAIADDLHEPLAAVTAVATFYFFFYAALQPVYGLLSDRLGRVRVMRWALAGMALANGAAAAAPGLGTLVAAKAVAAAFAAALLPTSLVYIADRVTFAARQHVVAGLLAAGAIGTTLATVGAGLLAGYASWRAAFAIMALIAVVLAVMVGSVPESLCAERRAGPLTQIRRVLSRRWALVVIALALAEGATMVGFITFLAPALEAHGESAALAGLVVASYGVAILLGMALLRRVIGATGAPAAALIATGGALLLAAYLTAAADQGPPSILLASVVIGLGYCFLHSTLQTWATEVVPDARGTATSLFVTAVFAGAAIATAAVSGLADEQRYGLVFLVAAAVTLPVTLVGTLARARYGAVA